MARTPFAFGPALILPLTLAMTVNLDVDGWEHRRPLPHSWDTFGPKLTTSRPHFLCLFKHESCVIAGKLENQPASLYQSDLCVMQFIALLDICGRSSDEPNA